jgi:hypothetical protein
MAGGLNNRDQMQSGGDQHHYTDRDRYQLKSKPGRVVVMAWFRTAFHVFQQNLYAVPDQSRRP